MQREIVIGRKLLKRLEHVCRCTDNFFGLYPGAVWEGAPAQHSKLQELGLITTYRPHNPVHNSTAIITDEGRELLAELRKGEG